MKRYRVLYGMILCISLIIFIFENSSPFLAIAFALIVLPVCLNIWLWMECRKLTFRIESIGQAKVGEMMQLRIVATGNHISSVGRIYGKASIIHVVLQKETEEKLLFLQNEKALETIFDYPIKHCGRIEVQINELRAYDCMGITSCKLKVKSEYTCLILPDEEAYLENSGMVRPFADDFVGIRDYREGDTMAGVHWKLSGKWDKLLVKEFGDMDIHPDDIVGESKCKMCTWKELCYNTYGAL